MPRPRLTPEQREARRKARAAFSFSDASYKHYNPRTEGYGSAEDWFAAADALAGGCGVLRSKAKTGLEADLELLSLSDLPADIAGLKKAFHNSLFIYHPDHGGTNDQCRAAMSAFERLSRQYK